MAYIKEASVSRSILALLGIALALCLFSSSSAAASVPKATLVSHFFPSGVRATSDSTADCWETSLAAPRQDSWRCTVGNIIYDPCFSLASQPNSVICDASPATDTRGLKFSLAGSLPLTTVTSVDTQPWVLQLSGGVYCTFATGATGLVDDERVDYGCTNNTVIAGLPKQGTIWTAKVVPLGQTHTIVTTVIHAWF
ncbi:hypothetical protein [Dictyobacter formicarum]|uniref:Ig-like domain-containing protein n=1 Tax=Dictyobacter formicarum TaxID=2778368 RepID=A0ABQ3VDR5_9CHLR|nr:hypothetical protein [Dictyobacter formicarum]GHO83538.1 hypothetical protein KSZ_15440 [Dictyobacter formicarum]